MIGQKKCISTFLIIFSLIGVVILPLIFTFFSIGINSMQVWTATARHEVSKKRDTKRLNHTGSHFRENLQLIGIC